MSRIIVQAFLFWASLLLLPVAAIGQTIEGPSTFPAHRLVRLTLTDLADGDSAAWAAFPFDLADLEEVGNGHGAVLVAPPGSRVDVLATYLKDGRLGQARHTVTIEGSAKPDPQPPTDPQPQPPANPVFNAEPSRPETFALLKAGQDYGARYSDPTGLALALEFFGQEVLARRSSPSEEAARDWIKQRVQDYGGSPGGAVATALDQAIQAAMEPVYRLEDGVWKLYDREFLAEVLRVLARGIHEGGQS